MKKTLAIVGSGDLGQLIAYHAINDGHFQNAVFLDDFAELNSSKGGFQVIGRTPDADALFKNKAFDELIIAVGYKHLKAKKNIYSAICAANIPLATIIHSSCYIDNSCKIGKGVFMLPGCTLDRNVIVGDNTLLNTACTIAHDTEIGSHCFLSPRVAIAGFVHVDELCVLGINCTIIDNITITSHTQIGGGAVVVASISDPGLYVGVPAKKIKNLSL